MSIRNNISPKKDTLIFGDSIIKHVKVTNADEINVYRGINSAQLCSKMENSTNKEASLIVLHVGTNDIMRWKNEDETMGEVYNAIRCAKKNFPRARVIVNGIVYRRDVPLRFINSVNKNIRWACNALNAIYCDLSRYLDDSCLCKDGLHLNRK